MASVCYSNDNDGSLPRKDYKNLTNAGTGASKTGGTYVAVPAEEVLAPKHLIRFKLHSGTFNYVMLHARYNGGIWKSLFKVNNETDRVRSEFLAKEVEKLGLGKPTHIIFSINGQHERYDPVAAQARVIIVDRSSVKSKNKQDKNNVSAGLKIISAQYGKNGKVCNAMPAVQNACNGKKSCEVISSNNLCGDPLFGTVKDLTVKYRCGSSTDAIVIREGTSSTISCN